MVYIFGTRTFGKVDRVPGLFFVTTKFFHINFLPLIPLGSFVVLEGSNTGYTFRGRSVGLSLKSLAVAWGRWVLVIAGLICGFIGLISLAAGARGDAVLLLSGFGLCLIPVLFLGLFIATFIFNKASHAQALHLGDQLGLSRRLVARHLGISAPADDRDVDDLLEAEPVRDDDDRRYPDRDDDDRDYDRRRRDDDYDRDDRDYDRRRGYDNRRRDRDDDYDRDRDYDRRRY